MIALKEIRDYLAGYDGGPMRIMEICGSHTAAIAKNGLRHLLSKEIELISGPGCPVCVTPTAYVDEAIRLAKAPGKCLVTFGDLLRVPGSKTSLSGAKSDGVRTEMVYSPMDVLALSEREPETEFVFAAIGFETTIPVYALLLETLIREDRKNIRLLTALKTMPPAVDFMMRKGAEIDGFLAPGHVSVITGSNAFRPLAERYGIPFGVAGFSGEELLVALHGIVKARGQGKVMNFYPSVVTENGNEKALALMDRYFEKTDAVWRGIGQIPGSGLKLREEYRCYDAGSEGLDIDQPQNKACCCDRVLTGRMRPEECPLFGNACTPLHPQGACMVSEEGSCNTVIRYGR